MTNIRIEKITYLDYEDLAEKLYDLRCRGWYSRHFIKERELKDRKGFEAVIVFDEREIIPSDFPY